MSALVVSNGAPFGLLANEAIAELLDATAKLNRVNNAITVAGGYQAGSPAGSAFEITSLSTITNNFGVLAGGTAGTNGQDWAYALSTLVGALNTFVAANQGQLNQLDQGAIAS